MTLLQAHQEQSSSWSYEEAFKRNRGLITESEQERLRNSHVAIAGMGGVGGVHLTTLARLGIGKFTIADPDTFDIANFNRQQGATLSALHRNKAEAMAEQALAINPEIDVQVFPEAVSEDNVDDFLDGADVYVDGLDFFAIDARRLVFKKAAEKGLWSVTAGPIGFSAAYLAFDPDGMSFDRYFDLNDGMDRDTQLAAFAVGLTPKMTHLPYMDLSHASIAEQTGPSAGLACQLASGVLSADVLRILLGRETPPAVPRFRQFDAHRNLFASGRLWFANRGPLQRVKRKVIEKRFSNQQTCEPRADSLLETLVLAFQKAPSGDNTQPWKLTFSNNTFSVAVDPTRDPSPMNHGQKMARIACGAAIENLTQTAVYNNASYTLTLHDDPLRVATIQVRDLDESACVGLPDPVAKRYTNRLPYNRKLVSAAGVDRLQAIISPEPGIQVSWAVERSQIEEISQFIAETDSAMFGEVDFLRAFLDNVRCSSQACAGLPIQSLGLPYFDRITLPLIKASPDALLRLSPIRTSIQHKSLHTAKRLIRSSSGVVSITTDGNDPKSDVRVGRMMQRVWLALTDLGYNAQPMMSYPVLVNAAPELVPDTADPFGSSHPPAAIMRFGFAPSTSCRTKRQTASISCDAP